MGGGGAWGCGSGAKHKHILSLTTSLLLSLNILLLPLLIRLLTLMSLLILLFIPMCKDLVRRHPVQQYARVSVRNGNLRHINFLRGSSARPGKMPTALADRTSSSRGEVPRRLLLEAPFTTTYAPEELLVSPALLEEGSGFPVHPQAATVAGLKHASKASVDPCLSWHQCLDINVAVWQSLGTTPVGCTRQTQLRLAWPDDK